ncbi:hypothetical protein H7J06_21585 [Mycobacterium hodleri]|uniref:hypothetical protein n=1 Tax=Mycolicibacterium hodleri TaxID=49897 RepID=UPI0021F37780|nr:hypothetical protein [Mycolicibacterium hodleri]MCV7135570.1 hypothetical protein [Mycolicibacterium hodleri]
MRTRVLVATGLVVVATAVASCDRTTDGTVAMTTQAGPPLPSSTSSRPTPSSPRTTLPPSSSPAPPPGDSFAVTCKQYVGLDEASRTAVVQEILKDETSVLSPGDADIAKTLADAVCTFLPDSTVAEILLGETPP